MPRTKENPPLKETNHFKQGRAGGKVPTKSGPAKKGREQGNSGKPWGGKPK